MDTRLRDAEDLMRLLGLLSTPVDLKTLAGNPHKVMLKGTLKGRGKESMHVRASNSGFVILRQKD